MHTKSHSPQASQTATNATTTTTITFTSGEYRLHGILHRPAGPGPFPLVIGCHGLLATGDSPKQLALAGRMTDTGWAYFRFDHRGCGHSSGDLHTATTFAGRCQDLKMAARMLLALPDLEPPLGLFGSSFGGAVCLACAGDIEAAAIVTLAAPMASAGIDAATIEDLLSPEPYPGALNRAALKFDLSQQVAALSHLLVIHGSEDDVVPFDNAVRIHAAAKAPKALLELQGGDHRISDPRHQERFLAESVKWYENNCQPDRP
jgi:alpha-beta hydrolase superfamily lysophospholipase